MAVNEPIAFETREALERWLKRNHDKQSELWVLIYKKASGTPSLDWADCVVAALAWGWIDGQKKSHDDVSYLQRITPRRARSGWSKKNCQLAEQLIADGRMQPPGLAQVEAARRDGRWEQAYAGSAQMVIPDDFLAALQKNAAAKKFYATLDRRNLFAIYHRLHTAKKPETRSKRIAAIIAQLAQGKPFH
jgi:uncharacterized protein YdeI (YjbR/CyaY-like superfamily)